MKQRTIHSLDELNELEQTIAASASRTAERLSKELLQSADLGGLARLKFEEVGCDPLELTRSLNFVEQLNQSFTYLATIEGVRWLFEHHGDRAPFHVNLGTAPGPDIASADGEIIAETFAATHPDSNDKIRKDLAKLRSISAKHRYLFYLSPTETKRSADDITIIRISHASLATGMPNTR